MVTAFHWSIDVHLTIERTSTSVVATIECKIDGGISTVVVDNGLIYIACHVNTWRLIYNFQHRITILVQNILTIFLFDSCFYINAAVSATEDTIAMEGRAFRHIDHRTAGNTFLITATINGFEISTRKVDDGRCLMGFCRITCNRLINAHSNATTFATTKHLCALKSCHVFRHIDEDIAAILHQVFFFFSEIALSGTIYLSYRIKRIVTLSRSEIDKSIA